MSSLRLVNLLSSCLTVSTLYKLVGLATELKVKHLLRYFYEMNFEATSALCNSVESSLKFLI